jgi:hypothetical protein
MVTHSWSGDGRRLGVWLDGREARIVDVSGLRASRMPAKVARIASGVPPWEPAPRRRPARTSWGEVERAMDAAEAVEAKQRDLRRRLQLAAYYASVVEMVAGASRVMIYGPGIEARDLYRVLLEDIRFAGTLEGLERTEAEVGEEELVEMVRDRLGEVELLRSGSSRPNF